MNIVNVFIWYQKKIGTYDKQKWETTIEQREQTMFGLTHIQTRSAKPNTNLIDLDLVRGSSFTKAKPQHGFIKVLKLATLRCIFYPLFGKWWIEQTSLYIFGVPYMEIVIPFIMMWTLSLVHSQIVATSPAFEPKKSKHKQRHYRKKRSVFKKIRKMEAMSTSHTNMNIKKDAPQHSVNGGEQESEVRQKRSLQNLKKNGKHIIYDADIEHSIHSRIHEDRNQNNSNITDYFETIHRENKDSLVKTVHKTNLCNTDSDSEVEPIYQSNKRILNIRRTVHVPTINVTSAVNGPYESDDDGILSSSEHKHSCPLPGDISSATEWIGVTTNSEDCSYSSDIENIPDSNTEHNDYMDFDSDIVPTAILYPPSLKVSCVIWERNEIKKADLSMLDISSAIIGRVDLMSESMDYFYIGIILATILPLLPIICKFFSGFSDHNFLETTQAVIKEIYRNITGIATSSTDLLLELEFYKNIITQSPILVIKYIYSTLNINIWEFSILATASLQRWILACMFFFLLCVAERTFKQRLLYAKLFSHLTSSRRARKSELPHFRLNKVRNIKIWLSVRSYLKKRGPQRSVDVIVSTAFVVNLLLLIFICVELLKDTVMFSQYYLETLVWCLGLGTFLLRFMTLGTKINKKYRNLSVLITEQINLHLQIEQKPHKKEELTVANNVLKLAIDLLKELESPFKISGLAANPILYNVTKVIILSALSGVLSEMLGFKLKLHKIKLK